MAELKADTKKIKEFLHEVANKRFEIPVFQRPYSWDTDNCSRLWDDIYNFHLYRREVGKQREEFFLGSIVTYRTNESDNLMIIDGQQRITTIFLLLRSIYKKLEEMEENDHVNGLKQQIGPLLWDVDEISNIVLDKKQFHLKSKVATDKEIITLNKILETGEFDGHDNNYSKNYLYFIKQWNALAQDQPLELYQFIVTILNYCIILPIICESQDAALRIFSTLNDRGTPLDDSDIFKAEIFNSKESKEAKDDFINDWKSIVENLEDSNLKINDIFRYYTHILRAKENDTSREIGLRNYFRGEDNSFSKLKSNNLLEDLKIVANFWVEYDSLISNKHINHDSIFMNDEIKKLLHLFNFYPNDFWKYPTTVYIYKNSKNLLDISEFTTFLNKMLKFLLVRFIKNPTVNEIKTAIYKLCVAIYNDGDFDNLLKIGEDEIKTTSENFTYLSSSKISKLLLYIKAYEINEQSFINFNAEVEHILPKKWQENNYNGWSRKDANELLEKFGNKVLIEKKINISAGNEYFKIKKEKYKSSKILDCKNLSTIENNNWSKNDILEREEDFKNTILTFLNN